MKKVTVGIAVVANRPRDAAETGAGANAIVLVADKQITQGTGLKADVEVEKKLALNYSWELLFAGSPSVAHQLGFHIRKLPRGHYTKRELLASDVESIYQVWWERTFDRIVLRRNLLTRKIITSPQPPLHLLRDYYVARAQFEDDYGTDLILAGFDGGRAALVLVVDGVSEIDQLGSYRVIGEGENAAVPRLHELGAQASDPLHVALYNALAAKFASEYVSSVGPGTDAWILRRNKRPHRVDQDLIAAVQKVTARRSLQWHSYRKNPPPLPVKGWQGRLVAYADAVLRGDDPKWEAANVSPNVTEQPSSLSQNDEQRSASRRGRVHPSTHQADQAQQRRGSSRRSQTPRSEKP